MSFSLMVVATLIVMIVARHKNPRGVGWRFFRCRLFDLIGSLGVAT
jgi:hypothetical protein